MLRIFFTTATIAVLALPGVASTYVVDDTAGPGVDFPDIQSAINASAPGDVIRVRAGLYPGFTLQIGVEILCDAGVAIAHQPFNVNVSSVPVGQRATISNLGVYSVHVTGCSGRVFLEQLSAGPVTVTGSADVRLRAGQFSLDAATSRVEVTSSSMFGRSGQDGGGPGDPSPLNGQPGQPAVLARNGADVHISASSIEGGQGGDGGYLFLYCPNFPGGDGGPGIQTLAGAVVLLTGTGADVVRGGTPGMGGDSLGGCAPGPSGQPGRAIDATGGTVLYSGVVVQGPTVGGQMVVPADPCLVATGNGMPGTPIQYTLYGQPGDEARLRIGRQMTVQDLPFVYEERLVVPLRSYLLGPMPASGHLSFTVNVPTGLPPNFVLVAQGSTIGAGTNESRLTQSAPIAVR